MVRVYFVILVILLLVLAAMLSYQWFAKNIDCQKKETIQTWLDITLFITLLTLVILMIVWFSNLSHYWILLMCMMILVSVVGLVIVSRKCKDYNIIVNIAMIIVSIIILGCSIMTVKPDLFSKMSFGSSLNMFKSKKKKKDIPSMRFSDLRENQLTVDDDEDDEFEDARDYISTGLDPGDLSGADSKMITNFLKK